MNYNFLLILLPIIYIISNIVLTIKNKNNITSPLFIFTTIYIISFCFCIMNITEWNINFKLTSFFVFLIGLIVFIVAKLLIDRISAKTKSQVDDKKADSISFKITNKWLVIMLVFNIAVIIAMFINIVAIAKNYGKISGLSSILNLYKNNVDYNNNMLLNPAIRILLKIVVANGYIAFLVLANNITTNFRKNKINTLISSLVVLSNVIMYTLRSDRGSTVALLFSGIIMCLVFLQQKDKLREKVTAKNTIVVSVILVLASIVFYAMAPLIGRVNNKKLVDYVSLYLGGSIECFNRVVDEEHEPSRYFGEYTFNYFYKDIHKNDENYVQSKKISPFQYNGTNMIGNVYTSYHRWNYDFGFTGMIVMQLLFSVTIILIYKKAIGKKCKNKVLWVFVYAYFTKYLLYHPTDAYFPLEIFCRAGILNFIVPMIFVVGITVYNQIEKMKDYDEKRKKHLIIEGKPDGEFNAASKARNDVIDILKEEYNLAYVQTVFGVQQKKYMKWLQAILYFYNYNVWKSAVCTMKKDDVVVIQYPILNTCFSFPKIVKKMNKKGIKTIFVIHDMESIRHKDDINISSKLLNRYNKEDNECLKNCYRIISHNSIMTKTLIDFGIEKEKIVDLELFDYLTEKVEYKDSKKNDGIIIAGNLSSIKAGYIKELKNIKGIRFNLYGIGLEEKDVGNNMDYKGAFKPDLLIDALTGGFGLIWDGDTANTCSGLYGNYLKYNNPHKTSLYLAAGIPIITWNQAAISKIVEEYKIGICVNSLDEIPTKISELSDKEYENIKNNSKKISKKLLNGEFLKDAISKCTSDLNLN